MANLLQVSSAFGRAMEAVDRNRLSLAVYPALLRAALEPAPTACAIAAVAEGYPFPTNLDRDQPIDGLAPPSQASLLTRAVRERWDTPRLRRELQSHAERRQSA